MFLFIVFFFFKQKTSYEMRISDWSSDVCSSDLCRGLLELGAEHEARVLLDDAEAEPGDDDAGNVAEAGGGDDDKGADRMDGAVERLDHPDHRDQHPGGDRKSTRLNSSD